MEHRLFLTGADSDTRLRLIREALGDKLAGAGGFAMCPEGTACLLRPAAALAGVEGLPEARVLDLSVWPPARDNEALRTFGAQLLREAAYYPWALLLELGGFELLIPQFSAALDALLQSGLPLLGALKTAEETAARRQLFGLGERFPARAAALRQTLSADARVLDLDETDEAQALSVLLAWAEAFA